MKELSELIIKHFIDYEFVYIFLFCNLVFFISVIYIKNKFLRIINIILFSVFFGLFLFEFVLSFQMDKFEFSKPYEHISNESKNVYIQHKIYVEDEHGNKLRYGFENKLDKERFLKKKKYNKIYDVTCSIRTDGFRSTKGNPLSKQTYVFLGCSFTFGDGLNDDETLPYYFSELMNFKLNVLNFGVIGKGTNLAISILNNDLIYKYADKDADKYFVYSLIQAHASRPFDLVRYGGSDNWIYKDNEWIKTSSMQPFARIKVFFARSFIFRKIFLVIIDESNKEFYERYLINSLKEINRTVEQKYNSKLTIIVWPEVGETIVNELTNEKIDIIILPKYLIEHQYKIPYDGHPNAKANKEIAEILYQHIKNNQVKLW